MFKVIGCITHDHDWRLVLLAAAVCLLTVGATFYLFARLPQPKRERSAWLVATGLVTGSGIWTVHFVAMLAFEPSLRFGFDPWITAASLVIAVVFCALGFASAAPAPDGSRRIVAGGCLVGIGIVLMHFTGMAALRVQGRLAWDIPYVVASIALAAGFAIAALRFGRPGAKARDQFAAGGLLLLGICGLHFTAMSAVTILPDPRILVPDQMMARPALAMAVVALTSLMVCVTGAALAIDLGMRRRAFSQIRDAIDAMADGMVIADADDRLVAWNARYAEQVAGDTIPMSVGMPYADLLRAVAATRLVVDEDGRAAWVEERLVARRTTSPDLEVMTLDGRWLRVHHRQTREGGVVTVCVDITDLKRNADVLAKALAVADAASRAKTEFLANITHEIRTPLNGVLGMSQVIAQGELPAIQRERLAVVQRSGEELLAILNDVLDVTHIESGKLALETGEIDAFALANALQAAFTPLAATKPQVRFEVRAQADCGGRRRSDPDRVRQLANILISNALKFTPAGEVRVEIAGLGPDGGEGLRLSVTDTGVGIAPEILPHLFEKFTQADGSNTRRFGGAGLGLTIAKPLVELMGGEIAVRSAVGQGSSFTITLPAPRLAQEPPAQRSSAA